MRAEFYNIGVLIKRCCLWLILQYIILEILCVFIQLVLLFCVLVWLNTKIKSDCGIKHFFNCWQTRISRQQNKIPTLGRSKHYHIVQNKKTNWTNLYIYGDDIFDWCKFGIVIHVIYYTPTFRYNQMHLI